MQLPTQAPLPNDWRAPLAAAPTEPAQAALLLGLRDAVLPLLARTKLRTDFLLRLGRGTTGRFGACTHFRDGRPPVVTVRCVGPGPAWRAPGAIVATLLHEAAHLKYLGHGPRFWALLRNLLEASQRAGIYHPEEDDPTEARSGNSKLAGTAADLVARATSARRRNTYQANRAALASWRPGQQATVTRGPLAGQVLGVIATRRSRVEVAAPDGLHYLVTAASLVPLAGGATETTTYADPETGP